MSNITLVTTCKNRLQYLKSTLPTWVKANPAEIVVVDYGCPENTGDWVQQNHPGVKVIRCLDDPGFLLPRARNLGAAAVKTDWIMFIDADIKIKPDLIVWVKEHLDPRYFYRASPQNGRRDPSSFGTVICTRKAYQKVGGYDEVFSGWGGEDTDLYKQLGRHGFLNAEYPFIYLDPINHSDAERSHYYDIKQIELHHVINETYMAAKNHMLDFYGAGTPLSAEVRRKLHQDIKMNVLGWGKTNNKQLSIKFKFSANSWLPTPYQLQRESELTLTIRNPAKATEHLQ